MTGALIALGPLPPPHHGAAKSTAAILGLLRGRNLEIVEARTSPQGGSAHQRGIGYHLSRAALCVRNCGRIVVGRLKGVRTAYMVPDGGRGIYYTVAYSLLLRLLGFRLFLHHHSYFYINKPNWQMKVVIALNPAAVHIFLADKMADDFDGAYHARVPRFVLCNAATNDVDAANVSDALPGRQTVITHLSNLTVEKGFREVAACFRELARLRPDFRFSLAGEPVGRTEAAILARLREELGDRLDYPGAIYGAEKAGFLAKADIFLFPTLYPQEAQPYAVFEALAAGCFVVATPRGCIPSMLEGFPSRMVNEGPALTNELVEAVIELAAADRAERRSDIIAIYRKVEDRAMAQLGALLSAIHEKATNASGGR